MASFNRHTTEPKVSSLADRATLPRPASNQSKESSSETPTKGVKRPVSRGWITVLVDAILLAVIVGLVVGGVFAYRAVRELYAPTWETHEIVFCVEITGVDPAMVKYGQDGRPTMTDHPLWSSDRIDADCLGTVTDVRTVLVSGEDGKNTLNLYLTVEAAAHYREGKGYRMGGTMLLAGMKGSFMLEGLIAEGTVISMHEKSDETQTEPTEGTVFIDPDNIDPDAQG